MTGEQRKLLVAILVPLFMSLLSISIVNVTLPTMQTSLGASDSAIQWVLSGYTLAFGVVLVAAGRAGDLLGRGRLFIAGLIVFGLGSLVSGLAPSPLILNVGRLVMGLGSGLLGPQGVGMIQQYFAGKARGVAFGMFGTVVGVSVAIGPVLGGLLVLGFGEQWGWRSSLLINVPIALIAMIVGRFWLPATAWSGPARVDPVAMSAQPAVSSAEPAASLGQRSARHGEPAVMSAEPAVSSAEPTVSSAEPTVLSAEPASRFAEPAALPARPAAPPGHPSETPVPARTLRRRPKADLDPVGAVILAVATLLIMLPFLERGAGAWIYLLLVVGIAAVAVWFKWEKRYAARGRAPMVQPQLFRTPSFSYGATISSVYFVGLTSVWVISALYLQNGLGFSALDSGLMSLPSAILSAVVPQITGRIVFTYGRKLVVAGIAVALAGIVGCIGVVLLEASHGLSAWWLLLTLSFIGVSQGMVISPNQTLTLAEVPVEYAGSSGGVMQTGQRVGTAVGLAIVTAVFFLGLERSGYTTAFVAAYIGIGAFIALAGVVGAIELAAGRARGRGSSR